MHAPQQRIGPLFEPVGYDDTKDPCILFDGTTWHIFGSRGSIREERWQILHATAPALDGLWTDHDPVQLIGMEGDRIAAPGVVYEDGVFHMFVQSDFLAAVSSIQHLTSTDGTVFTCQDTVVRTEPLSDEAGIYDPHPAIIRGQKYIVYSASAGIVGGAPEGFRPRPDLYVVRSVSNTWDGPWEREGRILDQETIPHHNRKDDPEYEWGIEGPQLLELPSGLILLNATSFVPGRRTGTRQHLFFAAAKQVNGPYATLGLILPTENAAEWEAGENGHASAMMIENQLHLFYQGRHARDMDHRENRWRYGHAMWDINDIERSAREALASNEI